MMLFIQPSESRKLNLNSVDGVMTTSMVIKSTIFWDITPCGPLTASQSTFRCNISPPYSGLKDKPSKN
jgi:hypothetical protein